MATDTVLVTGGAGFIGSQPVEALLAAVGGVVVIDDRSTGTAEHVAPDADLETLDIVGAAALDAGGRPCTSCSDLPPRGTVERHRVRPRSASRLLGQRRRHPQRPGGGEPAPRTGGLSSTGGALYGNRAPITSPEESLPAAVAPYGAYKWSGEAYLVTWREASCIPHSICRLGPRQCPHGEAGVVAIFSHHIWQGTRPKLFGDGRPTRDYVHRSDVAAASLAASGAAGTDNVATDIEVDVRTVFESLRRTAGFNWSRCWPDRPRRNL